MKAQNILETIGNTPNVKINRLFKRNDVEVWIKLERANPGGSIKDRIALAMIEEAEKSGILTKETEIIEPTSGNTGIGLAMVAAVKGYKLTLVMPESMSIERRKYLAALGANLVLTPKEKGMRGAIEKSEELVKQASKAWVPQQFKNQANVEVHKKTAAAEILKDFPNGVDYLITGVGTGGQITGCAEVLKQKSPKTKVFAVEPEASPVLSGGSPGPHPIQGIGAGFVPEILKKELLDGVVQVSAEDSFKMAVRCVKEEGIFIGISSGATLAAIEKKLSDAPAGSVILGFCYDTGERYHSVPGLFE